MRLSELHDRLPNWAEARRSGMLSITSGAAVWLKALWWGVRIGPGCRFYGVPVIRRAPGSTIGIDRDCTFCSGRTTNLAGIDRPCYLATLNPGAIVSIGSHSGFSGTVIAAAERVTIGRSVLCGVNTFISDTDWHSCDPNARSAAGAVRTAPVLIEDNVWLGANVMVLKGVTIGRNSVIGAGSVVTRSIPPDVVAAGVPASVVRRLVVHA